MRARLCPTCNRSPIRREELDHTWLECPDCRLQGGHFSINSDDYAYLQSMEAWNIKTILHPPPLLNTRAKLGDFLTANEPRWNKGHAAVQQTPADVCCTNAQKPPPINCAFTQKTPPIFAPTRKKPPPSYGEPAGSSSIPSGFDPVDPADTGDPRNHRRHSKP
jgi:hypothetical protein